MLHTVGRQVRRQPSRSIWHPAQQSRRIHTPDVSLMMEVQATYHPSFGVFATVCDAAHGENFSSILRTFCTKLIYEV